MSVYTHITQRQLNDFLEHYSVGRLKQFAGIQASIDNTNYTVMTSQGEFILTLFESITQTELPYYLDLMHHLCQNDFPVPNPQACKTSQFIKTLNNKPTVLFSRLAGKSVENPTIQQCHQIGEHLARLHLCSQSYHFNKPNVKNLAGCQTVFNKIKSNLSKKDISLLNSEINFQSTYSLPALPKGTIHADLFRDNVLFDKSRISGILDFYNACTDYLIFDIAVTINDWCIEKAKINQQKFNSFLSGYQKTRTLQKDEKKHLVIFLRLAALRFYLSRVYHQLNPKEGMLTLTKNPLPFCRLLENYRTNPELLDDICISTQ